MFVPGELFTYRVLQYLKDLSNPSATANPRPPHIRTLSVPVAGPRRGSDVRHDERQPLLRRRSYDAFDPTGEDVPPAARVAGGTILGIHNLAIVAPQLIVRFHPLVCFFLSLPPRLPL